MNQQNNNSIKISEDTQIDLPTNRVYMSVERRDWNRVKRLIGQINDSFNRWENGAWSSLAAALSFIIAALSTSPVNVIFLIIGIGCVIICFILFAVSRTMTQTLNNSKCEVLLQMKEVEENLGSEQGALIGVQNLSVSKAVYGANGVGIDVTEKLNSLIENNALRIKANNSMAGDPTPGVIKTLVVDFCFNGINLNKVVNENEELTLP
jgi:hypothetical protein